MTLAYILAYNILFYLFIFFYGTILLTLSAEALEIGRKR